MSDHESDPLTSTAMVTTDKASRYLQQLCKHFGHKRPVNFTPEHGSIEFDFGACTLSAGEKMLTMTVSAGTPEDLERMRSVIASHLERFAFREPPAIDWR
ncbi:DUF2218 domain-containing protein [Nitratireductor sp. CAU 1489]|uniref:DUF2218 domain-containing protein n=1 Tax=Nitratireductor arenosus TaxID=2682096 RepID=A0A844QEC5_9HYPH|nr:DUF2218 domain-containing protein [Nitratireductor arenosus]MVA97367.1 DUF2218 domain-containing protein [Nitratireductor arenosus]